MKDNIKNYKRINESIDTHFDDDESLCLDNVFKKKNIIINNENTDIIRKEKNKNITLLISGGFAGMIAKTFIAPLDRVKILYQVTNEAFKLRYIPQLMKDIYLLEGVRGLWKGNSAMMLRIFPYAGIQFMTFDIWKKTILQEKKHMSFMESLLGGAIAGAVSTIFTYPLDLARSQIAVHGCDNQRTTIYSVLNLSFKDGGLKSFFRGITPTLFGIIPYAGIAFTINDRLKQRVITKYGHVSTPKKLIIGGIAGIIAQTTTYPLEVIRRRMQTSGLIDRNSIKSGYDKIISYNKHISQKVQLNDVISAIYKSQGLKGFFKGVSLNWIKGPTTISISFTCFDLIKGLMGIKNEYRSH